MREERLRQSDLLRAVEAIDDRPPGGEWLVGQVYTASSIPTCSACVYLVHPVTVGGAETEGGAGTLAVDATRSVPVVVLNSAPAVGDYLIARSAGGRWVSDTGGTGGGTAHLACSPCGIPLADMTASWTTGSGISGPLGNNPPSGSGALVYYPTGIPGGGFFGAFTGPSWWRFPTASGSIPQYDTEIQLGCGSGTFGFFMQALTWNGSNWIPQSTCYGLIANKAFFYTSCAIAETANITTSQSCSPLAVTGTVVNTANNPNATKFWSGISITE